MRPALKFGLWTMVGAGILTTLFGDQLSLAMVATQPMKMAAAEATYDTVCGADASFSLFTLGTPDGTTELFSIRVPYLLSFLSTHTFDGCVEGINDLQAQYQALYGPGDYAPIIWVTYWSFRWMIGLGLAARARRRRRPVAHPQGADAEAGVDLEGRDLELPALARRDDRRLDLHRDGPPALDRVQPAADRVGRLAERDRASTC